MIKDILLTIMLNENSMGKIYALKRKVYLTL